MSGVLNKTCPKHDVSLVPKRTKYGKRWSCPVKGCDICCWNGPTSTPANKQLRTYRHRLHELFDPLWSNAEKVFSTRGEAYLWLSSKMLLHQRETHFGMFSIQQCREAEVHIKNLIKGNVK